MTLRIILAASITCALALLPRMAHGAPVPGDGALGTGVALTLSGTALIPVSIALEAGDRDPRNNDYEGATLVRLTFLPLLFSGVPLWIAGGVTRATAAGVTDDPELRRIWAEYLVARAVVVPVLAVGQVFGAVSLAAAFAVNHETGSYWDSDPYFSWPSVLAPAVGFSLQVVGYALAAREYSHRRVLDGQGLPGVDDPGDLLKIAGISGLVSGLALFGAASSTLMTWSSGRTVAFATTAAFGALGVGAGVTMLVLARQEARRFARHEAARAVAPARVQLVGVAPFADPADRTVGLGATFRF